MNCPACAAPLLFGASTCPCGYSISASSDQEADRSIELSYFEALRAYWRVYWPIQLVGATGLFFATGTALDLLLQFVLGAAALFVFAGRIVSRPYRGFAIVIAPTGGGEPSRRLTLRQRFDIWAFLWWRQMIAGGLAAFLAGPLNALLHLLGVSGTQWIMVAGGVLVIGPILLKMLIGHSFEAFLILAQRRERVRAAAGQ